MHILLAEDHLYIIAFTADVTPEVRERCLAGGTEGFVAKPVELSELVAALEQAARA